MKEKLLIAALAMVGGCDHQFGIGALDLDGGVADAQPSSVGGTDALNLFPGEPWVGFLGPTTWTGHVDDHQFPSGSNTIRLALAADSLARLGPFGPSFQAFLKAFTPWPSARPRPGSRLCPRKRTPMMTARMTQSQGARIPAIT